MLNSSNANEINPNYSSDSGLQLLKDIYNTFFQSNRQTVVVGGLTFISLPSKLTLSALPNNSNLMFVEGGDTYAYVRKQDQEYILLVVWNSQWSELRYSRSPETIDTNIDHSEFYLGFIQAHANI